MAAVARRRVGTEPAVQMGIDTRKAQSQSFILELSMCSGSRLMGVVFLLHLRGRAVIAIGDEGGYAAVGIERAVDGAVGTEERELQGTGQFHRGSSSLKVVGFGA